jgi:hypothetical protein
VAGSLEVDQARLRDARLAEAASHSYSLDAPVRGGSGITALAELLGEDDGRIEHQLAGLAAAPRAAENCGCLRWNARHVVAQ